MLTSQWFTHQLSLARWDYCPFSISHSQCKGKHLFLYSVSVPLQYETLLVFDTSQNETIVIDKNPALPWKGGHFPSSVPENLDGNTHIQIDGVEIGCLSVISWSLFQVRLYVLFCQCFCVCVCASRLKYAGCDCDRSESQCCCGDSHRSHLLQVNSRTHFTAVSHVLHVFLF